MVRGKKWSDFFLINHLSSFVQALLQIVFTNYLWSARLVIQPLSFSKTSHSNSLSPQVI